MNKKLDVEGITNELHGASLFFNPPKPEDRPAQQEALPSSSPQGELQPATELPEHLHGRTPEQANARTGEQVNTRTRERPNTRTPERAISRQSYNVYDDQHQALKRLEAESALSGENAIHLSEMVRQALDDYLAKRNKTGANARTGEHPNA